MKPAGYLRLFCRGCSIAWVTSCVSHSPAPDLDLDSPGWRVRTGQALWAAEGGDRPIAGDIVIALNEDGGAWIDFSTSSVPVFQARISGDYWWIDMFLKDKHWSGRGDPPARFVWFAVIDAVFESEPPRNWEAAVTAFNEWTISKPGDGEFVRLILDP